MNRKLIALDIVLGVGVIYGGFQLHSQWAAAKARQAAMPGPAPKAAPVAPMPPLPTPAAVSPGGYKDVAMHDLFDATRNPNVPVDAPPPPPPPPEPPPLPSFHGMMNFGDAEGPVAVISDDHTPGLQQVHAGEMVGEFKLVAFNRQEMTLDWKGRVIHKRLGEDTRDQAQAKPGQAVQPLTTNGVIPGQALPQDNNPQQQQNAQLGPGPDLGNGVRACQAGDSNAPGTVQDGYQKVVSVTPFGSGQCIWKAVGR